MLMINFISLAMANEYTHKLEAKITPIDFGAFANVFHASGDKVYIGRWECSGGGDVAIGRYDRNSLLPLDEIKIADCDSEQQDEITSITSDNKSLYLVVSYRYPQADRINFVVIDKASFKIIQKSFVKGGLGTLLYHQDKLLSCDENGCSIFDPLTLTKLPETKLHCSPKQFWDFNNVICSNSNPYKAKVSTRNYNISWAHPGNQVQIYSKSDNSKREVLLGEAGGYGYQIYPVPNQDALLITHKLSGDAELIYLDLVLGSLIKVPVATDADGIGGIAIFNNQLFVGLTHDLLVYDLPSLVLKARFQDLITEGPDKANWRDKNAIARLIIDQDRLIVLTYDGKKSRTINLTEFTDR
jgi:hypothetical protein